MESVNNPILKEVNSQTDCERTGITYFIKETGSYLHRYESDGQIFQMIFEPHEEYGKYTGSLRSEKYGFADQEGINAFAFMRHFKKFVSDMQNRENINTLYFNHLSSLHTVEELTLISEYLLKQGYKEIETMPDNLLISTFKNEFKLHGNKASEVFKNLYQKMFESNEDDRIKKAKEAEQKRFDFFFKLYQKIFKDQNVSFEIIGTNLIVHFL